MNIALTPAYRRGIWVALFGIILVRLFSLGAYPLQDTTEARYAEIARLMLETGNWVTPQFDYGILFWGKRPLAIWLSAGSFQLFGVTEFAARLPSLLFAIMVLFTVYILGKRQRGADLGLVTAFVLASSILFFIVSGAVLMDTALVAGTTLSMVAFWLRMNNGSRKWGYLFFIGLVIGLLSKGPLALVLVGTPIGLWALWQRNLTQVWQRIPWLSGGLLMLALTLPWYILAELRSPGFIDYFIVGEHWKRFTVTGWQGDLYGSAHAKPRGTIWLYAFQSFLPWAVLLLFINWRKGSAVRTMISSDRPWIIYLGLWAITPLLFFTFSGNLLATYALPSMVPLALLGAESWMRICAASVANHGQCKPWLKKLPYLGVFVPLLLLSAIGFQHSQYIKIKSQKALLTAYSRIKTQPGGQLVYLLKRPFSAQFYSRGKALEAKNWQQAMTYFYNDKQDYYVIKSSQLKDLPSYLQRGLREVGEYNRYSLLQEID